jgi:hypothetical protein
LSGDRSEVLRKEVGAIILWRSTWGRGEDWEIKKRSRNNENDSLLDAQENTKVEDGAALQDSLLPAEV